eukprot:PhF_6_TR2356/c0_g2_i2/m.4231
MNSSIPPDLQQQTFDLLQSTPNPSQHILNYFHFIQQHSDMDVVHRCSRALAGVGDWKQCLHIFLSERLWRRRKKPHDIALALHSIVTNCSHNSTKSFLVEKLLSYTSSWEDAVRVVGLHPYYLAKNNLTCASNVL